MQKGLSGLLDDKDIGRERIRSSTGHAGYHIRVTLVGSAATLVET